jgi:hypothetical protein
MRPDAPVAIRAALATLGELAAGRTDHDEVARLYSVSTLLRVLGEEWDAAAAMRVAAIARYRGVLHRARPLVGGALGARLDGVLTQIDGEDPDLRISALDRTLDDIRSAVIELQTEFERSERPKDRDLLVELWDAAYEEAGMDDRHGAFW